MTTSPVERNAHTKLLLKPTETKRQEHSNRKHTKKMPLLTAAKREMTTWRSWEARMTNTARMLVPELPQRGRQDMLLTVLRAEDHV